MNEEYFDIVDENNKPTGEKALRSEAHTKGLWHRTVHIYLYRRHGNSIDFLIQLRSKDKDLDPDKWQPRFGGHVRAGETVEETIEKETKEEIGLDVSHEYLRRIGVIKNGIFPDNEYQYSFFLEFEHEEDLVFNDGEVQGVEWVEADDILDSIKNTDRPWARDLGAFEGVYKSLMNQL